MEIEPCVNLRSHAGLENTIIRGAVIAAAGKHWFYKKRLNDEINVYKKKNSKNKSSEEKTIKIKSKVNFEKLKSNFIFKKILSYMKKKKLP